MSIKISKADAKMMITQSKEMVKNSEITKRISTDAIRKANLDITAAKAIIKHLGGK